MRPPCLMPSCLLFLAPEEASALKHLDMQFAQSSLPTFPVAYSWVWGRMPQQHHTMVGGVAQERGPGDSRRTSGLLGFSVPVTLSPNWEIGCSKYPWPLKSLPCRVRRKLKGARVGPSQVLGLGGVSSCLAQTAALGMHSLCFRVSHCLHLELLH